MKHTLFLLIALLLAPLGLLPNVSAADPKSPHAWPFTTEHGLGKNLDGVRVRDEKFQWSWETPVVVGQLLEIAPYAEFAGDKSEAHCLLTTPDNKFVYVPYVKGNNAIYQYRFDAESGQMTALEPKNANPPEGTGPRHMAYHPTKPVVYFSNEQHLGVSSWDIAETGALKLRQICDAFAKDTPKDGASASDIVLSLDGRFLFCGIRGRTPEFNSISRYRVKDGGDLEFLGLTPTDKIPWGFALSPAGRFLMVAAYEGATLKAYQISHSGELQEAGSLAWDNNIMSIVTR